MIPLVNEPPEVELGDPPVAKAGRRALRTSGRVANRVLIAVFVISVTLMLLDAPAPGMCAQTPEREMAAISGLILLARPTWRILKTGNDLAERWLDLPDRPQP